ncbi:hypothetical protein BKA82DRAFT_25321 [Pisolithus tinctorius]|nr:hypothetical protein BKA82DRAFT_25321 [Pisolithus tinctorius]
MQEIPPDPEGSPAAEHEEKEGKDEERGNTFSVEGRSDMCISRHECFEGVNDMDQDNRVGESWATRNGGEGGKEVDVFGGPSLAKPGGTITEPGNMAFGSSRFE